MLHTCMESFVYKLQHNLFIIICFIDGATSISLCLSVGILLHMCKAMKKVRTHYPHPPEVSVGDMPACAILCFALKASV